MPGMKAFVAAVFGGIGSIPGAVLGAFIIGIFESLIKGLDTILGQGGLGLIQTQWELATFSDAFTFLLLIIVLLYKPTGLFGEKVTDKV
jgi:branched-chain amino acid transport system permease protein